MLNSPFPEQFFPPRLSFPCWDCVLRGGGDRQPPQTPPSHFVPSFFMINQSFNSALFFLCDVFFCFFDLKISCPSIRVGNLLSYYIAVVHICTSWRLLYRI
jgi:hypothetical protein